MASLSYPDTTKVNPSEKVFFVTPHPSSEEMSSQAMHQQVPYAPSMQTPLINPQAEHATQPSVISMQPSEPGAFTLNSRIVFRLGICTLVFGSINMICGICAIALFGDSDLNNATSGICCFNFIISYFRRCSKSFTVRDWYRSSWKSIQNSKCPDKDGARATYSLILICTCAQIGISTAMVIFTSRAYPGCRRCTSNCLVECAKDCCCDSQPTSYRTIVNKPQSLETGYGRMSQNFQQMPPGQILYMMTPVAVTTQHPQNAPVNPTPQATFVMNS